MRTLVVALSLAALAACGATPDAGRNEVAANTAAPVAPAAGLARWREDTVNGCIGGARDTVRDPNLPVERHCACAADRVMAGKSLAALEADERSGAHEARFRTALRQCIAEISPDYPLRAN